MLLTTLVWSEVVAVAHPVEAFEPAATVVWTPTFQAAWDAVNREVGAEVVESGSELAKRLDDFEWKADEVLPQDRWRVWSGMATPELHREADAGAREMLGVDEEVFPEIRGLWDKEGTPVTYAAYALLAAKLRYFRPLYRSRERGMDFTDAEGASAPVHFFGVRGSASASFGRIRVLHRAERSHALQIPATESGEVGDLVLYLPEESEGFDEACGRLRKWRQAWEKSPADWNKENDPGFHELDQLRVPYVRFQSRSDFREGLMESRRYRGDPQPYRIGAAWQQVDFQLGEEGAEVRATAGVGLDPFGSAPKPSRPVPRDFSFDRPFFVMLWRGQTDWPYFAAWVGGTEGMEDWKE